jgi:4-hydroxy-3-methylbut-2-enyl diphosphate reductase
MKQAWIADAKTVGVTAGASAPEVVVEQVVAQLREWGAAVVTETGYRETVVFNLPRELVQRQEPGLKAALRL